MSRLTKNIVYNLSGQFFRIVLGFVSIHYIFKKFGGDTLGIIYLALTFNLTIVAIVDIGIGFTTVKEISAHLEHDPIYIQDLLKTASLFYWGAYLFLVVVIYFGARWLVEYWIHLETIDKPLAILVMQTLGISALVGLPRSLYASVFRGLQRMEFNNLIDVGTTVLQQAGIILILVWGGNLLMVVNWIAASFFLGVLCSLVAVRGFFPWKVLVPGFSRAVVHRNLHFSSRTMMISIVAMIQMQVDKLIIGKLLPVSLLGYYGFAYGVCGKANMFAASVSYAAFPAYAENLERKNYDTLFSQYKKVEQLVCLGTFPIFAAIPFASPLILRWVFNSEVARLMLLPVILLSLGFYLNGTLNIPFTFSLAVGKPEITARFYLWALIIFLPLTIVLIYFQGLIGAGLAWVLYNVFGYIYAIPKICSGCLHIPSSGWYWRMSKIVLLGGLSYGVAGWILWVRGGSSIISLAAAYLLASMVFLLYVYSAMGEELRGNMKRYIPERLKRIILKAT
jgi:O-antigen/teichoic acid export membrane protein